ncbi:NUDIX domain-containing protein [Paenibacillus terreus]|uniref:NUDIX domain-containing protein n=1 Tax=Paenibacillus terreus TaxID=1387834 RepID=A0ABV5BEN2_9BACL
MIKMKFFVLFGLNTCLNRGCGNFQGGEIEQGEDHTTALMREIKEELHCDIVVGE